MNILLSQIGTPCECFITTSLIKGLQKKYDNVNISIIVKSVLQKKIFAHNQSVANVFLLNNIKSILPEYDVFINLSPDLPISYKESVKSQLTCGFGFDEKNDKYVDILYGDKKTHRNIFQVYFSIAGLTWKGESYDFHYYPHSRTNKKKAGIAIVNANIRSQIAEKLLLSSSKLWNIPYKKNFFSKIDEINKCQYVVTDDIVSMHLAVFLRKYVYFFETNSSTTEPEFFGKGETVSIPAEFLRWF